MSEELDVALVSRFKTHIEKNVRGYLFGESVSQKIDINVRNSRVSFEQEDVGDVDLKHTVLVEHAKRELKLPMDIVMLANHSSLSEIVRANSVRATKQLFGQGVAPDQCLRDLKTLATLLCDDSARRDFIEASIGLRDEWRGESVVGFPDPKVISMMGWNLNHC